MAGNPNQQPLVDTAAIQRIETIVTEISERVRGLEMREAGCSPLMTSQMSAAFRNLDNHEGRLKVLETSITQKAAKSEVEADLKERREKVDKEIDAILATLAELKSTNKILAWVGGLVGSAIVLYIINAVLHLI